jgi:hypothetical protein
VQVDTRRLGAELAAPLDETLYLQVSNARKKSVRVGKSTDGAPRHPYHRELGEYAKINLSP